MGLTVLRGNSIIMWECFDRIPWEKSLLFFFFFFWGTL
jgi:hypothetical protein